MSGKLLVVLLLSVAYALPSNHSNEEAIDCDKLPADVQEYVNSQLSTVTDGKDEVELTNPPQALIEAIHKSKESSRVKRRICRYVAIRNRRTGRTVVFIRCR